MEKHKDKLMVLVDYDQYLMDKLEEMTDGMIVSRITAGTVSVETLTKASESIVNSYVELEEQDADDDEVKFLHKKSLVLGKMFSDAYRQRGPNDRLTEILLERYRATRRQIPGVCDDHGSTRYGAHEAYHATQD